jgi:hypothetical protein
MNGERRTEKKPHLTIDRTLHPAAFAADLNKRKQHPLGGMLFFHVL